MHDEITALGIAWRLGATLFFVLLNGFFVAAEFALVKVRASRIQALAKKGRKQALIVRHILDHLDHYLSACQLGITLASLILGALGEPAVSVLLLAGLRGLGVEVSPDATWLPILSIGLAFTVITVLHMTVGEQAPKMWALQRAEATSMQTARTLHVFAWLLAPFIWVINAISNAMLRLAGVSSGGHHDATHTTEEIRSILSLSASAGGISEHEFELTENVFRMTHLEVRHIMVPRPEIAFLNLEHSPEENLRKIRESGHSRFPVSEGGLDKLIGFVHTKDLLETALAGKDPDLRALARDAQLVPDTMPVSRFLLELQKTQGHGAAVIDEHGTVLGFAYREDALEEIVGPLGDEFDDVERQFVQISDDAFDVSGQLSMPEACERLGIDLGGAHENEETIGGHVTARLGRMPKEGDQVTVGEWQATVTEFAHRRVQRLRFERLPAPSTDGAESGS